MEKELEKYIKGYRGPIVIYKLRQLIMKDPKNAPLYLLAACQYARANGFVGLYDELYSLQKKLPALADAKLPPYEDSWSKAEQAKYKQEAQKKDSEIVKAVSNQMRDAIRVSHFFPLMLQPKKKIAVFSGSRRY